MKLAFLAPTLILLCTPALADKGVFQLTTTTDYRITWIVDTRSGDVMRCSSNYVDPGQCIKSSKAPAQKKFEIGTFQIFPSRTEGDNSSSIWLINTSTGQVSKCGMETYKPKESFSCKDLPIEQ
jgi:hypothetical protein